MLTTVLRFSVAVLGIALADQALAHHATGGETPQTALQGLVSGLAHPVIGPDHLAFVVGIGVLSAFVRSGWALPAVFLTAGAAGTALHLGAHALPAGELLVAVSVLLMGAALLARRGTPLVLLSGLCGFGGLVHGYALAESIVGAQAAPLWSYLFGVAVVQLVLSLAIREGMRVWLARSRRTADGAIVAASLCILAVGTAMPLLAA
jgi:urease accessory protein